MRHALARTLPGPVVGALRRLRRAARRFERTVVYEGVSIPMDDPNIHGPVASLIRQHRYEFGEVRALKAMLQPDDVVLEVGAGIGFLSCLCSKLVGGDRVHAYEPDPRLRASITRLHALNGVTPNVTFGAVSDAAGTARLATAETFWDSRLAESGVEVPSYAFDDVLASTGATFVLLDCEGTERELLLERTLPPAVRKLVVELHPELIGARDCTRIVAGLLADGFELRFDLSGGSLWALHR